MKEEILRILKMVEQGKINADQGEKLISALLEPEKKKGAKKFLKIKVDDAEGNKVNVVLPLGLVKLATKFIPREKLEILAEKEIKLDEIISALKEETEGEIVNVEDADGSKVRIWVE